MNHEFENLKRENTRLRGLQEESVRLLKASKGQCGMMLGEEIEEHVALLTGSHFNSKEYHYERPVGEQ